MSIWGGGELGVLDLMNASASVATPTTITDLIIPTVNVQRGCIAYNNSTGVITFLESTDYHLVLMFNVNTSASRTLFSYAEIDTGSGFVPIRYSARRLDVTATTDGIKTFSSTNFFTAGTKLKFKHWATGAMTYQSTDVPLTTPGTVTVPAIRLLYTT